MGEYLHLQRPQKYGAGSHAHYPSVSTPVCPGRSLSSLRNHLVSCSFPLSPPHATQGSVGAAGWDQQCGAPRCLCNAATHSVLHSLGRDAAASKKPQGAHGGGRGTKRHLLGHAQASTSQQKRLGDNGGQGSRGRRLGRWSRSFGWRLEWGRRFAIFWLFWFFAPPPLSPQRKFASICTRACVIHSVFPG